MNTPKISIVIPVYNVEKYLNTCIDSVINQTFTDIEIVCVNDGSTDNSLTILDDYCKKDNRIVVVDCKENGGLLVARKKGVEAASGEYMVFLDSDDYVDANLCQFIADITEKVDADIIHFSADVASDKSASDYTGLKNALKPFEKELYNDDILENAFVKRTFATQVWAKIYKKELCKKVYELMPDEHCYVGEDVLAMFFLTMFAKKYVGIKTPPYYFYRYGLGVSGKSSINLSKFEMYAKMSNWAEFTADYLEKHGANAVQKTAYENLKNRLFADCCDIYDRRVKVSDKTQARELIFKYWNKIQTDEKLWKKCTGFDKNFIENQMLINEEAFKARRYTEEKPVLSFIICGYNVADEYKKTVDSLIKSSENIEVICVNNGSSDTTSEILKTVFENDDRISVINLKYTSTAQAKNQALDMANGKYICMLKPGQIIESDKLDSIISDIKADRDIIFVSDNCDTNIDRNKVILSLINEKDCDETAVIISKKLIDDSKIYFDNRIANPESLFVIMSVINASEIYSAESISDTKVFDDVAIAQKFADCFVMSNIFNTILIGETIDDAKAEIIGYLVKHYDTQAKKLYCKMTDAEKRAAKKQIPDRFMFLYNKFKELEEIKLSKSYNFAQTLVTKVSKLTNR